MLKETIGRSGNWVLGGMAAGLAATGIPPNLITWLSLILNLWAGMLFAAGRFAAGGGLMICAALCDMLDGPVARRQGRVSVFGGFLHSILDRYSDLILFLGLLVYYAQVNRFVYAVVVGAAMAGSVMVSYSKARAESLIGKCDVGFWERPERIALMILGALSNRMELALWILAIGPNITVVHRIIYTWKRTGAVLPTDAQSSTTCSHASLPAPSEMPEAHVLTRTAGRGA
jgi:CDP-diacylglycerol--glycerol-3-phosphate 3-phosphatidyltransferase